MTQTPLNSLISKLKSTDPDVREVEAAVLAAGLEDLRNRMAHLEHAHLRTLVQTRAVSDRVDRHDADIATLTADRDEFRKTVNKATDTPIANEKKIVELEERVRACEGAVGAAPYKAPTVVEPASPDKEIKPVPLNPFPSAPTNGAEPIHA